MSLAATAQLTYVYVTDNKQQAIREQQGAADLKSKSGIRNEWHVCSKRQWDPLYFFINLIQATCMPLKQGSHMDRKRAIDCSEHCHTVLKHSRTMQEATELWEWPVVAQKEKQMLPYWVYGNIQQHQSSKAAAAPAASLCETRDTLSLGNWANRQVSLELSLGAGYCRNSAGSPGCDAEDAETEDTAASSCSESSGCSIRQSDTSSNGHTQQEQKQHSGEDDSITSNQCQSAPSAAFSFGCLPVADDGLEVKWPAVEVGAQ